jgi:hypothetical protein
MSSHLRTRSHDCGRSPDACCGETAERAWGLVQSVDLVGRDLTVLLHTGVAVFDIPPDCPIVLHGEPIKLRMVQPRDHVWVTFQRKPPLLVARQLVVQPDRGFTGVRL